MLLGSTTAKVLNDADCAVMTTQHAETLSPRPLEHREWVCAIGLSADSERVLRYASQIAETFHANLSLLHAVPAAQPGLPVQLDLEERVQLMEVQAARERFRELQRVVGSHARVTIAVGPIKEALTRGSAPFAGGRAGDREKFTVRRSRPLAGSHLRHGSRRALSGGKRLTLAISVRVTTPAPAAPPLLNQEGSFKSSRRR